MADFIDVLITCPDRRTAETIARACVEERLAACANISGPIASVYRWKGAMEEAEEVPLFLKTRRSLFETLSARVKGLHPYEVPCIVAMDLTLVDPVYADWLRAETGG
jgi:periplasmic divalent cation tolerance protein